MYNSIRLATMMAIVLAIAGSIVFFSDENDAEALGINSDTINKYLDDDCYKIGQDMYLTGDISIDKPIVFTQSATFTLTDYSITYNGAGSPIIVEEGITLTIDGDANNIDIEISGGTLRIESNITLTGSMSSGQIIIDNSNKSGSVSIHTTFSMTGGTITNNGTLTSRIDSESSDSRTIINKGILYEYTISSDEFSLTRVATADDKTIDSLYIPRTIEDVPVTSIGDSAFADCLGIKKIARPIGISNLKSIGDGAFSGCANLTGVYLDSVTSIGDGAFSGCSSLTDLSLKGMGTITKAMLSGCTSLEQLTLSYDCKIKDGALAGFSNLSVKLGSDNYLVNPDGSLTQADEDNANFVIETTNGPCYYLDLVTAVTSADSGSTIKMLKDTTIEPITIEKTTLTIDLGGYQLTIDDSAVQRDSSTYGIYFIGGTLTIKNGDIVDARDSTDRNGGYTAVNSMGNLNIVDVDLTIYDAMNTSNSNNIGYRITNSQTLTISGNSTITTDSMTGADCGSVGVVVLGLGNMVNTTNLVLEDDTTISVGQYGISGNGTIPGADSSTDYRGTTITIRDNAQVTAANGWGIYHPQDGTLNIQDNANVSGLTGIEIRSGTLNMTGGTVESIATGSNAFAIDADSGGATTTGVGIAVVQHTTKLNITVDVIGGGVKGYYAVFQEDVAENGDESAQKIDITLRSGNFESTGTGSVTTNDKTYAPSAVYGEQEKDMVVGGNYSSDVSDYVAEGSEIQQNPDGSFVVTSEEDTQLPYPPIWDDDDDYVPPIYVPSQTTDDDDTVKIVACAAAAVVAAIMAAFLVLGNKKD